MFTRNIFTTRPTMRDRLIDTLFAIALGICLAGLALAYFDILTK